MLRYSYKIQVKNLELVKLKLDMDLIKNPNNEKVKRKLIDIKKQISWFNKRINEGRDPGTIVI